MNVATDVEALKSSLDTKHVSDKARRSKITECIAKKKSRVDEVCLRKFVDDTTASEIIPKNQLDNAQLIADKVGEWSTVNRMQLNSDKCKELWIYFFGVFLFN